MTKSSNNFLEGKNKVLVFAVAIIIPLFCALLLLMGGIGGWLAYVNMQETAVVTEANQEEVEAEIVTIATDFAEKEDFETAQARLAALEVPNVDQYIAFMVDRRIQENRIDEPETMNLYLLADALGSATPSMAMVLATPTSQPSPTLPSTSTPTPTVPLVVEATSSSLEEAGFEEVGEEEEEIVTEVEEEVISTAEPTPTETPPPTETSPPTDTPEPLPTATPAPPTNTPEPTATPTPEKPAVDFVLTDVHMIPNPVYDTCPGAHQIFVTVVDAEGKPLDGVTVEDKARAVPPHVSGEKGPGKLEYDLWSNGYALEVTKAADGSPVTSEVTPKLSSVDEDIPNEWLIEANYCRDMNDCLDRKSRNGLCRGHYAYEVVFQKTY